jgi:hypothetical protein
MSPIPSTFYTMPKYVAILVTHQQKRAIMQATNGVVDSCGCKWRIRVETLKKGMFILSLRRM